MKNIGNMKTQCLGICMCLFGGCISTHTLYANGISGRETDAGKTVYSDSVSLSSQEDFALRTRYKETAVRYHSFAIRAGIGSWTEKAAGKSATHGEKLFLRADYEYMFTKVPQMGIDLFYTYSQNDGKAYLLNTYQYGLGWFGMKKVNCTYHLHYLGPQFIYKPTWESFSLKFGAGVGGALLTLDIPGDNERKFGWMYSLDVGMELALSRHFSLVLDYYFMNSFFKYDGYDKIPGGTLKIRHHIGLLGLSYYF